MLKKIALFTLCFCLLCGVACAEITLPLNARFGMSLQEVCGLCEDYSLIADEEDPEVGTVMTEQCSAGIGDMVADGLFFDVSRENGDLQGKLMSVTAYLPVIEHSVADFRAALKALTAAYGEPENDPFDAFSVSEYVEFGSLSASWSTDEARCSLTLARSSSGDSLYIYYASRINYSASDLAE